MGKKIAVSKSGKDVLTATDPNDFIFNSDFNTFKIVLSGTVVIPPIAGSTATATITHGLGTRNGFILFWQNDDEQVYFHDTLIGNYGTATGPDRVTTSNSNSVTGYMSDTELVIQYFSQAGITSAKVRYYIFEVPN